MNADAAAALRTRLEADTDADLSTMRTTTDKALAIGADVWRLRWRRQPTTAVAADAGLHSTCGAVLDALALLEHTLADAQGADPALDLTGVNVLIDRATPSDDPSECDQALRSMRDATGGAARIWYRREAVGWQEDCAPAPTWPLADKRVDHWLHEYLLPRLNTAPGPLARAILAAVNDPSLHLYPSEIKAGATDRWALRLDGLQIGTASLTTATLAIGKPGKAGDGPQRKVFTEVFGQPSVTVSMAGDLVMGQMSVADAATGIHRLLSRFREAAVCGAPISHRMSGGVRIIDEHTLEARLLKGLCRLDGGNDLVRDDTEVARGSQFPTLWGHGGKPRYLDALVQRGTTPLAVELKVATGGRGRYYRRSLLQAVLYRHFIRNAPGLDPWFQAAGLDRMATEGSIGLPIPPRWTPGFDIELDRLRRIAGRVGAQVHVLDDRFTPDWVATEGLSEPNAPEIELLSWRMAAALASRWPRSLGRVVERHDCGGFYDQLQLQGAGADRTLDPPFPRPRITLHRPARCGCGRRAVLPAGRGGRSGAISPTERPPGRRLSLWAPSPAWGRASKPRLRASPTSRWRSSRKSADRGGNGAARGRATARSRRGSSAIKYPFADTAGPRPQECSPPSPESGAPPAMARRRSSSIRRASAPGHTPTAPSRSSWAVTRPSV